MSYRDGTAILLIKKTTADMGGDYKLIATNVHGESTVSLSLVVKSERAIFYTATSPFISLIIKNCELKLR